MSQSIRAVICAAHLVVPGAAVWVDLGGAGDGVAAGTWRGRR